VRICCAISGFVDIELDHPDGRFCGRTFFEDRPKLLQGPPPRCQKSTTTARRTTVDDLAIKLRMTPLRGRQRHRDQVPLASLFLPV